MIGVILQEDMEVADREKRTGIVLVEYALASVFMVISVGEGEIGVDMTAGTVLVDDMAEVHVACVYMVGTAGKVIEEEVTDEEMVAAEEDKAIEIAGIDLDVTGAVVVVIGGAELCEVISVAEEDVGMEIVVLDMAVEEVPVNRERAMVDEVLAVGAGEVVGIAVAAVGEGLDELIAVQEVDEGMEVAVLDVAVGAIVADKEVRVEEVIVAAEVLEMVVVDDVGIAVKDVDEGREVQVVGEVIAVQEGIDIAVADGEVGAVVDKMIEVGVDGAVWVEVVDEDRGMGGGRMDGLRIVEQGER